MEYLGVVQLGSLYLDSTPIPLPTRPWVSDNYPGSLSDKGNGNTYESSSFSKYKLGDTDSKDTYQLKWIKIKDGNKYIYICDRVILNGVSWDELNTVGYVTGTTISIDGQTYTCRLLTGGTKPRSLDAHAGGDPISNEWDRIIANENNIEGLPKPQSYDLAIYNNTYQSFDGEQNQLWHWWGSNTICKEANETYNYKVTIRGFTSCKYYSTLNKVDGNSATGWRPVLEQEIPIDPPGKPIPVYPTSEDKTHPEPIKGEITLQTKYNGDGSLEQMDVSVYNYTQQKFEYQSEWIDNTTGIMQLPVTFKAGNNYKITVIHKGTGGIGTEWLELYVIGGVLGKYKLSEPITAEQFKTVSVYGQTQNLVMKTQAFPETEGSKVRLVPEVMNKITVASVSGNDLVFADSTKTPTIGDKLIKDNQIYNITNIITKAPETHVSSEIFKITNSSNNRISFGSHTYGAGHKSYVVNGRVYTVSIDTTTKDSQNVVRCTSIPLEGGTPEGHLGSTFADILRTVTITGKDNMIYVVANTLSVLYIYAYNIDTKKGVSKYLGHPGSSFYAHSTTMDSVTGNLVIATKEFNSGMSSYELRCYWVDVSNLDNITRPAERTIYSESNVDYISDPFVEDTKDYRDGNISVCFAVNNSSGTIDIVESIQKMGGQVGSNVSRMTQDGYRANYSHICSKLFKDNNGKYVWIIAYSFSENANSFRVATFTQTTNEKGQYVNSYWTFPMIYTSIPVVGLISSKSQGFILIASSKDGIIRQTTRSSAEVNWGAVTTVTEVAERTDSKLFDTVDYNPESYGQHPGLVILDYDEVNKVDRLMLKSDYSMENIIESKITLDKPIIADMGEVIKYYDYDIEVQAGEDRALIKPTDITDEYYEYDAQFNSKKSERDITIRGRNTKLTTLYYYNY